MSYDTLNKLVKFFGFPPGEFLKYYNGEMTFKLSNASSKQIKHNILLPPDEHYRPAVLLSCSGFNPVFLIMPLKPLIIHDRFNHQQIMDILLYYTNIGKYAMYKPSNHDRYMVDTIDDFNYRFCKYITSRIILHSGIISKSDDTNKYDIDINSGMDYSNTIKLSSLYIHFGSPYFQASDNNYLLKIWKKQPVKNKHHLLASNTGKPIKLYDYTTNNFAK